MRFLIRGHISNKLHIKPEYEKYAENFYKFTNISIYDYRDSLYQVTKSLIKDPIVNRSTFELDDNVKEEIFSLPDDEIIVPLDDDDWINPALQINSGNYTIWDYIHFDTTQPNYCKYDVYKLNDEDYTYTPEEFKKVSRRYFPSCAYSVPVKMVKDFENQPKELHRLLFLHGAVPGVLYRNYRKTKHIYPQSIIKEYNGCFLTHIGNYSTSCINIRASIDNLIQSNLTLESWMQTPYEKLKKIYTDFWG